MTEFTQTQHEFYGSDLIICSLTFAIRQRIVKNVTIVLALEILLPISGFYLGYFEAVEQMNSSNQL